MLQALENQNSRAFLNYYIAKESLTFEHSFYLEDSGNSEIHLTYPEVGVLHPKTERFKSDLAFLRLSCKLFR